MQLCADDIQIRQFVPDDGSESAAVKLIHRTSGTEVVNSATISQRENLRKCVVEMIQSLNPHPDRIRTPRFLLFDEVRITLPESYHHGEITRQSWDFACKEWKYYVTCKNHVVDAWYFAGDLSLDEFV